MIETDLPLVSVGLPVYNRPEGLRRTLECFTNQTYSNIEIIIADNCSPDPEVEKIAREYLAKDSRISYYKHAENKGWGFNTNFVIEKAKGDYFLRATDDDWWDVTFIEKIVHQMRLDPSIELGFCNYFAQTEEGVKGEHYPDFFPLMHKFEHKSLRIRIKNYIKQFEGHGKSNLYFSIVKTNHLKNDFVKETLKNEVLAGDLLINLFLLLKGRAFIHSEVLFKVTYGNEKLYDTHKEETNKVNLLLVELDLLRFQYLIKKWKPYLITLKTVLDFEKLSILERWSLKFVIIKKINQFYFDSILNSIRIRGWNFVNLLKRKHSLQ
jgi:glycosyltransferase involved in cell wall biosynthesis